MNEDFEFSWDFGETVKLEDAVENVKNDLQAIRFLGDTEWKKQKANSALIDLENKLK